MWGICYDEKICRGKLFQRPVCYKTDGEKALITEPLEAETSVHNIRPTLPPTYPFGTEVTLLDAPDKKCVVREIIWLSKRFTYLYRLEINGRKRRHKYKEQELILLPKKKEENKDTSSKKKEESKNG